MGGNAIMQALGVAGKKHTSVGYGASSYGGNLTKR
jgi:hypothetical protein